MMTRLAASALSLTLAACGSSAPGLGGLSVSDGALDFGRVEVGATSTRTLTVVNEGDRPLAVSPSVFPTGLEAFFVSLRPRPRLGSSALTLAPGGEATIEVTFAPQVPGALSATLRMDVSGGAAEVEVALSGQGATACTLTLDPVGLDFGNVVVGTTETLSVQVVNSCDQDAEIEFVNGNNVLRCDQNQSDPSTFCVRPLDLNLDEQGRVQLMSGASASIEVEFSPKVGGIRSGGEFLLRPCASSTCDVLVPLTGNGVESGLRCRPPTLDFGPVNPGTSRSLSATCENIANEPLTILSWAVTLDSDPAFEVEASRPQLLSAGDTLTLETTFSPARLGDATGRLRVETNQPSPAQPSLDIALEASGGGPDIDVLPAVIDFGEVSTIAPARRSFTIVNTGFAPLLTRSIAVDTAGTGALRSPDAVATVLQPGESLVVTLQLEPIAAGEIVTGVRIASNDIDEPTLDLAVRGEGVSVPPCRFSIQPPALDFGAVLRTRTLVRGFEIRNEGADRCLLTGVRLVGGSDPAFSLVEEAQTSRVLAGGATETVQVAFSPMAAGSSVGEVEVSLSSPASPFNSVRIRGTGVDGGPLIAPRELSFGDRRLQCGASAQPVRIHNTGTDPIQIDEIALSSGTAGSVFRLSGLPATPFTLRPGNTLTFGAAFSGQTESGRFSDAIEVRGSQSNLPTTWFVALSASAQREGEQSDVFRQLPSEIDVLFVVDGSGSMLDEQLELGNNFAALARFAEGQGSSYQVGVISTGVDVLAGRLLSAPVNATRMSTPGGPPQNRIVAPQTIPSPGRVFAGNVQVPDSGGSSIDEAGLLSAQLALSDPVVFGHNAGFLRRDAALSVVFMSDESDQSNLVPGAFESIDFYEDFFRSIKGGSRSAFFMAHAITAGNGTCTGPGGTASSNGRYVNLANRTQGSFQSICTADWPRALGDMGPAVFGFRTRFPLSQPPVVSTIEVVVDGSPVLPVGPGGEIRWSFSIPGNTVDFPATTAPGPGSEVRVAYTLDCR